jgi:putative tricarboxylic transport membrane protein
LLIGSNDLSIFVRGPITWVFIALTVVSISLAVYRFVSSRRVAGNAVDEPSQM